MRVLMLGVWEFRRFWEFRIDLSIFFSHLQEYTELLATLGYVMGLISVKVLCLPSLKRHIIRESNPIEPAVMIANSRAEIEKSK